MKNRVRGFSAVLMAGLLCFTAAGTYSYKEVSAAPEPAGDQMTEGIMMPSELALPALEEFGFSEIGLNVTLPDSLREDMEQKKTVMLTRGETTEDGLAVIYGLLCWDVLTQEQWDTEVNILENGYSEWEDSLERAGAVGVYQSDLTDQLDELTRCDEHLELGQTDDGVYKYYLSINTEADAELTGDIRQIQAVITEMVSLEDMDGAGTAGAEAACTSLGEFTAQDIYGATYTQDMFKDYDLTMINIFTTWCSPCVAEIPELEELHQQMADQGVNVVGVALDTLNEKGEVDQEALEKARILAEKTGATYPFLIPDSTYLNGRLVGIQAVPETFFVDKDGNIVGRTYSGSNDLEGWLSAVEQELADLKG